MLWQFLFLHKKLNYSIEKPGRISKLSIYYIFIVQGEVCPAADGLRVEAACVRGGGGGGRQGAPRHHHALLRQEAGGQQGGLHSPGHRGQGGRLCPHHARGGVFLAVRFPWKASLPVLFVGTLTPNLPHKIVQMEHIGRGSQYTTILLFWYIFLGHYNIVQCKYLTKVKH